MSARRLLTQKYHNRRYSDSIKIYTIQCANFVSPTNLSISSRLGVVCIMDPAFESAVLCNSHSCPLRMIDKRNLMMKIMKGWAESERGALGN